MTSFGQYGRFAEKSEREVEDEFGFHGFPVFIQSQFNKGVLSGDCHHKFDATNVPALSLCL
jgi:hypothetical protein